MKQKTIKFSLIILLSIMSIRSQRYFSGEPCLNLKGIYSPINVLNNNIHAIVDALDPFRDDSSIERLNRFKFVFKLLRKSKQPMFVGVLTTLVEKKKNEYEQEVIKQIQSPDFEDIKDVLLYGKDEQDSKLKCPLLKKHFYQSLRNYLGLDAIREIVNIPVDTNQPIEQEKPAIVVAAEKKLQEEQQNSGLNLTVDPQEVEQQPKTVAEVYQSFDLSVLQDLPDTAEFNVTYNKLAGELNEYSNDAVKTEEVLTELFSFIKNYKDSNQINKFLIDF